MKDLREERRRIKELIVVVFLLSIWGNLFASALYDLIPVAQLQFSMGILFVLLIATIAWILLKMIISSWPLIPPIPVVFVYSRQSRFAYDLYAGYRAYFDFGGACEKLFEQKTNYRQKLQSYDLKDKFFSDLLEYVLFSWLKEKYSHTWLYEKPVRHTNMITYQHKERPSKILNFSDLPKSIKEDNIFFSTLSKNSKYSNYFDTFTITVPKDTKIYTEPTNRRTGESVNIVLENNYCKIKIAGEVAGRGLGGEHHGTLGAILQPWRKVTPLSEQEKINDFTSLRYIISFTATFNRTKRMFSYFFSWLPQIESIEDYYDWAEFMLEELKYDFDWDLYLASQNTEIIRIQAELSELKNQIQRLLDESERSRLNE